ncbi:antirepressor [candidate division WOR-1 bacterium RIFOXYB2_FULL_42_35]|uniref:Antirepressor n=1 Tax=candidate division WOR-1 bacterium RIFOXYC2_FULL_41_25 TaxID=1802586 RepID=A0A1F4TLA3_UNCSA|nr:MAG: antirepressor [candidate division WOR-1 bacterium RIFOXYA2_FULL_41_14]OGC22072.1 MAG: antirepressor [candidate division WOR-1 bacterium RIFOXYB2_FULL_42_35]OGC32833.1 MAG: antirepressor [candidate division WOR-1 bacterium RIFOXYC2_FULL_41_25]OGC44149.1 MAG: antirepressor [candidate division WOR-1 bacterium RIFOXYD2_FULL_41_8]
MKNSLAIFEGYGIRRYWDEKQQQWYFSIIDVIGMLTGSTIPKRYWSDLKKKLIKEGSQVYEEIVQLKFKAADGKKYATDCFSTQALIRVIQSIPSPKAEPFKLWLAKVGYERLQEISDPEKSLDRARENWQKLGRSEKWIRQRMQGQETRNKLTDYWQDHEVKKGEEFAILTNVIHQEWAGLSVKDHKKLKRLERQNLRDHMSEAELIFTALAEMSTRQIAETIQAKGMPENKVAGLKGGRIAKKARLELEAKTGKRIVTPENYLPPEENKRMLDA